MVHSGLNLAPVSRNQRLDGQSAFFGRVQFLKAKNAQPRALLRLNKRASRLAITARAAPESSANVPAASPTSPLFELFPEGTASVSQALRAAMPPSHLKESSSRASGPSRVAVRSSAEQKVLLLKMFTTKLGHTAPGAATSASTNASASPGVSQPARRKGSRASNTSRSSKHGSSPKAEEVKKASKVVLRLHAVQPGETLHSIARRYRIPVDAIRAVNEKAASGVRVSEVLFLPSPARMEEAATAVQGLGGEHAVILLSPKARMLLRKATVPSADPRAEAGATSTSRTLFDLCRSVQSALDLGTVSSQGQQVRLELMGVTSEAVSSAVARQAPGTTSQASSREGSATSAAFASVQAASPFGSRGLYGPEGEVTAGAIFGRSSLAIGVCLLLLGSASSLQSFLLKQLGPDGALLGVGKALRAQLVEDTDASFLPSEPVDPAQRTARRFLTELKARGRQRTSTEMLLEEYRLGIPTGDEVLLRRARSPRDLVTELGCIDSGLCVEVIESSEEEEGWRSQASELEYYEAHAASVKSAVAGLVAAVEFNPDWDVKTAREANLKATSSDSSLEQA